MSKDDIKSENLFIEGHPEETKLEAVPYASETEQDSNILSHLSRAQLLSDVDRFVRDKGLEDHVEDIRKGALLAQKPSSFKDLPELTASDKDAIHHENTHRWSHPMALYFTIAICSLG